MNQTDIELGLIGLAITHSLCFLAGVWLFTGSKIQIETDEEFEARKAVEAWARLGLKPPEKSDV